MAIPDPKAESSALVNWINTHGGLAGHPIKLLYEQSDPTTSTPEAQQDQSACAAFTEDHHVAVAVSDASATPSFYQCMAAHHTPLVIGTATAIANSVYASYPDTLFSVTPSTDRIGMTQADDAQLQGYFTPSSKIGIVSTNDPTYNTGANGFQQEAARYGAKVVDKASICNVCSSQEQSTEASSAVIKFRGDSINEVVMADSASGLPYLEAEEAASYYPRLDISSLLLPSTLALEVTPAVLNGSIGEGYAPSSDVNAAQDGPENQTPRRQLCHQIMRNAGIQENDRIATVAEEYTCELFFFLQTAVNQAGTVDAGALRTAVRTAVERLSTAYQPVVGWKTYFGANRHDGEQQYRPMTYSISCRCFSYAGGLHEFSHLSNQQD
jgi:ABC-type branched-subunit amino acid transport system substrate-binding protein